MSLKFKVEYSMFLKFVFGFVLLTFNLNSQNALVLKHNISEDLSPKSVVHSGDGLFAAQNMMYKHTVTFYDRNFTKLSTVHDDIDLSYFDSTKKSMMYWGAPVEGVFSDHGKYYWVSNYSMQGGDFKNPGCDECIGKNYDHSYVYKINTWNFEIEDAVEVGSVPKYMAVSEPLKILVVSNWTSGDISVISTINDKVLKKINVGRFPRGLAIHSANNKIYVALMGERRIAVIDVKTWGLTYIENIGSALRHLCLDEENEFLYVSINDEARIAKINLKDNAVQYCETGSQPRSMVLSSDGKYLYVVNYDESTVAKVYTKSFKMLNRTQTNDRPIGIALDEKQGDVWVACYSGTIMIFHDPVIVKESNWLADLFKKFDINPEVKREVVPEIKKEPEKEIVKEEPLIVKKEESAIEKKPEIKVPEEEKIEEIVSPVPIAKVDWIIVAGSFKNRDLAEKYHKQIIEDGYESEILLKTNGFYLITCGSADTKEKIQVLLKKVKKDYGEVWVAKRGG